MPRKATQKPQKAATACQLGKHPPNRRIGRTCALCMKADAWPGRK